MKRLITAAILLASMTSIAAEKVTHRFFKAGWNSGGPGVYSADFKPEWELNDRNELSDGWMLPDNSVVFSFSIRKKKEAGVIRLDANKKEVWRYIAPDNHDNHSCQPLPDGGFLLGECAADGLWMVEIDKDGKEAKRVKVADKTKDKHHAFRLVRKTPEGTYLGTVMRENKAYEWDGSGKLLRTFPNGLFIAIRLPNGNTLVSAGHATPKHGAVIEYDKEGKVVWELTEADINTLGIKVSMVCGIHRLPNGNTVISSAKHGKPQGTGDTVKAFEITREKKLVWSIPSSTSKGNMGSIQILDIDGGSNNSKLLR